MLESFEFDKTIQLSLPLWAIQQPTVLQENPALQASLLDSDISASQREIWNPVSLKSMPGISWHVIAAYSACFNNI